eukprot:7706816-Lingulodinium_polyedra.AAC.1
MLLVALRAPGLVCDILVGRPPPAVPSAVPCRRSAVPAPRPSPPRPARGGIGSPRCWQRGNSAGQPQPPCCCWP